MNLREKEKDKEDLMNRNYNENKHFKLIKSNCLYSKVNKITGQQLRKQINLNNQNKWKKILLWLMTDDATSHYIKLTR